MRTKPTIKLETLSSWNLVLFSIIGAVLITDSVTGVVSWLIWREISLGLLLLGTINATVVPLILSPVLIRLVKRTTNLEALNQQLRQQAIERQRVEQEREALIRELEAKNAELEQFTYTVSHDLKAPLITIRGFLGYVEKDAQAGNLERLKADMARIIEATDKMQRLLAELLELSRIGRMMNPPQAVPFEAIAREAVELVRGHIDARGVRVEIASDLPAVYGDRARLVEVVQNLVDNGCKFTGDQPEPRIEIGQQGADTDGKPILFVRDNGMGIEPQHHERVFGLFNKLDAQSEGTGVGLALVRRIVEVHGGRIWVESELGQGATFLFTLGTGG